MLFGQILDLLSSDSEYIYLIICTDDGFENEYFDLSDKDDSMRLLYFYADYEVMEIHFNVEEGNSEYESYIYIKEVNENGN